MFHPNSIYLKKQSGSGISDVIYKGVMKKAGVKGMDRLYPGEKHAPILMSDGSLQVGNYIGPGTQAPKRAARGDRGITPVDDLAMRHDALYSLAKTKKDIRLADEDFLRILKRGVVKDHPMNLRTGELGIASKYAAETRTGVKFPTSKELAMNNQNDEKLLNIVRMTDRMYGVQSGKGIMDVLQKIINWLFGSSKVPNYNIPPEEPREEEPVKNRCKELLAEHGIVDSRSFKRWALRNHPDKVPDDRKDEATELFKEIKNCMESEQVGQGFSLANFKKAADKYSRISKDLGIKPEDGLNAIKAKAKEKGFSFGSGQSGSGFWDFLSVLSVLPIPFFSDVARTISLVATPIRISSGTFTPALDGMVTDTMREIASIFPKEIQDTILKPATAIAESVGFGLKQMGDGLDDVIKAYELEKYSKAFAASRRDAWMKAKGQKQAGSGGVTPMQKVQSLYAMVKKIDDAKDKILRLEPKTRDKMINMRHKTKQVADYIMGKLGATPVTMPDPYIESMYSREH